MKNKLPKLNPVFKSKWVDALRSGKYKQGNGALYDSNRGEYCCLGVGAHICGASDSELDYGDFIMQSKKPNEYPDELVWGHPSYLWERLSEYNDDEKSFKWIASYIERYL